MESISLFSGPVNTSASVAFAARLNTPQHNLQSGQRIPFDTIQLNIGNGFHGNGEFTAPVDGLYWFYWDIMTAGNYEIDVKFYDDKSGVPTSGATVRGFGNHSLHVHLAAGNLSLGYAGASGGHLMKMVSYQKVWLQVDGEFPYLHSDHTTFTGFKLGMNHRFFANL